MTRIFSKRILMSVVAFFGCIAIAFTALAVPTISNSTRMVTVDTNTIITENYHGVGDNLWPSAYNFGMNDAYQAVNEQRTNTIKSAYIRMSFYPHWMMDLSQTAEQQQYNWENGIYTWENEDFKGFVKNCEALRDAGSKIVLNFGGMVPVEVVSWYGIKNAALSEGGKRAAPKNIDAYANAVVGAIRKLEELGIEVEYLSFQNEVNNGNFEAFGDKRIYWCEVLKRTSIALDKAGLRSIALNKAGTRDGVYIFATELVGWPDDIFVIDFLEYAKEQLVDKGYADGLVTHLYWWDYYNYNDVVRLTKKLNDYFPEDKMFINEFNGKYTNATTEEHTFEYKNDTIASIIAQTNAGLDGAANWFYYGQYIPHPSNVPLCDLGSNLWRSPSRGLEQVGESYGTKGLASRYIPKFSKVVKTETDSDDVIAATYIKDDDCTILLSVDKADSARKLKVYIGEEFKGRTFGVHINNAPIDHDGDGENDDSLPRIGGDLLPVRSENIVVDQNGYMEWNIPYGDGIRNMSVVLTTMDEQVQVQLESAELCVQPGASVDISVKDVFGVDCTDFKFEIYDYSKVTDEKEDYKRASSETLNSIGVLEQNASGTATFTASANLNVGDTIAIKVTPNATMSDDASGYAIAILNVGQYRLYYTHDFMDTTVDEPSYLINEGVNESIDDIITEKPKWEGYKFEGWYLTPDFSGEAVTRTDPAWNSTVHLYGKWSKTE